MVFKMKYKNLEEIVEQLHGASKMHKGQAKKLEKHINDMEGSKKSPVEKKKGDKGSWEYGGDTYYGTFIKEDENAEYYKTHNDKIKKKLKN